MRASTRMPQILVVMDALLRASLAWPLLQILFIETDMASREDLTLIRDARAGKTLAQVALGKRYLFGEKGAAINFITALYWLDRAAQQGEQAAWLLIGGHIPFETALLTSQPSKLIPWYERAFDAGIVQAGLVLARLVLTQCTAPVEEDLRHKAWRALEVAAEADIAEAQWWLAQQIEPIDTGALRGAAAGYNTSITAAPPYQPAHLEWVTRAAENGVSQAQRALANQAWAKADHATFLRWALPIGRAIARQAVIHNGVDQRLREDDAMLLSRCAQILFDTADFDAIEIERFWELAAQAGDKHAQFALGLWLAKMDANGKHVAGIPRAVNYRKAIRWLMSAGEQGISDAWYAISKIYLKPEFAQRGLADAEHYLENAGEAGHLAAQLELGKRAWRTRASVPCNDVRAVYWLQKAAAQGSVAAQWLLKKNATLPAPADWAQAAQHRLTASANPFLAARIELAALFGLSEPEALLIDVTTADHWHCLVVDIRAQRARSKRRLILIQTGEQRQTLSRIARLFENVDCGPYGPEGNYRQRLYRLQATLSPTETKTLKGRPRLVELVPATTKMATVTA